jgi:hypothetical protein
MELAMILVQVTMQWLFFLEPNAGAQTMRQPRLSAPLFVTSPVLALGPNGVEILVLDYMPTS